MAVEGGNAGGEDVPEEVEKFEGVEGNEKEQGEDLEERVNCGGGVFVTLVAMIEDLILLF